jgi:hypothetical protein
MSRSLQQILAGVGPLREVEEQRAAAYIRQACLDIQQRWSRREELRCRGWAPDVIETNSHHYTIPEVHDVREGP